jgi:hypothetical protein
MTLSEIVSRADALREAGWGTLAEFLSRGNILAREAVALIGFAVSVVLGLAQEEVRELHASLTDYVLVALPFLASLAQRVFVASASTVADLVEKLGYREEGTGDADEPFIHPTQ